MSKTKHIEYRSGIVWLVCLLALVPAVVAFAEEPAAAKSEADSLLDMSLEQLTEITVAGTLTEMNPHKMPASVTTITAEDIAVTPARNLLDLIEIYVPSAMWLTHSVGPAVAMRGIVADRNYKYLVIVNGIVVNNGLYYGAQSELSMWDLGDIEKVEVIRGPGSVTYGPGAIGGVINITLKRAGTAPGTEVSAFYWDKYMARGASIGHGYLDKGDGPNVYGYFSYTDMLGVNPDNFNVYGSGRTDQALGYAGYLGTNSLVYSGRPAAKYWNSFYDEPSLKAYINANFKNGWKFWSRYTTGRIPTNTSTDTKYQIDGDWESFRLMRNRQYLATLEKTLKLNEDWDLIATFNFTSTELKNVYRFITTAGYDNDQDNLRNITQWATENKWFNRLQFNYDSGDNWKAAFGTEFAYKTYGPGWGRDRNNGLRLDDMISGESSDAYGPFSNTTGFTGPGTANYIPIGHGWKANQHAVFGELNVDLSEKLSALISARVDKHSYTDYMFSPRAAMTYELEPDRFLKLVAQRSVRMNTEEELFKTNYSGQSNKPEKLTTYEIMYQAYAEDGWEFLATTFYNDNDVIAWNSVTRSSTPVGNLRTIGAELEAAYRSEKVYFGANHSYVKLLRWQLAEGLTTSGISYGDYYYDTTYTTRVDGDDTVYPVYLRSTGNDLNNYSDHMTKFFGNIKLADDKLTLHGDMKVLWGFPGSKDGLDMTKHGGGITSGYDELKKYDAYGMLINGNVSLTWHLDKSADFTVYVQNIPIKGDNKRYSYSSGNKSPTAEKTGWIEEPMMVGVRYTARF